MQHTVRQKKLGDKMFGYINVNRKDLTKKNIEQYQSYYCGLCDELKRFSGRKGQLLLNYDMTFLILLLSGLYELEDRTERFTCPLHPAKKKTRRINEATKYAAKMNVLLSYQSFADDWKDEGSKSKRIMMSMFRKDYEEIFAEYPRQGQAVETYIRRLHVSEEDRDQNIDAVAGLTGDLLAEIFAWKEEDRWTEELRCLGFYMGKFIYIMDAYEDIDKDKKEHGYNVLFETKREHPEDFDTFCKLMLVSMMSECAKSFERMPILLHADIIRNILYGGVWNRYEYIQVKKQRKDKQRKTRRAVDKRKEKEV
jgi:hypothetical protein